MRPCLVGAFGIWADRSLPVGIQVEPRLRRDKSGGSCVVCIGRQIMELVPICVGV